MEEPTLASDGGGKVWASWLSREKDDELVLVCVHDAGEWSRPMRVTPTSDKYESPRIACAPGGHPMVAWVRIDGDRWLLESSLHDGGGFGKARAVPALTGKAASPALAAGADGSFHLAWESYNEGRFRICLSTYDTGGWSSPMEVTDGSANAYDPALAVDPDSGKVWVAYSAVDNEVERAVFLSGYDMKTGQLDCAVEIAVGGRLKGAPNNNTYPSVLCDDEGRVWVAFQNDGPHSKRSGSPCFQGAQECLVVCYAEGRLRTVEPTGEGCAGREVLTGGDTLFPALASDGDGHIAVFARELRPKVAYEGTGPWRCEYVFRASCLDGPGGWRPDVKPLADDVEVGALSRTAVTSAGENAFWIAWQEDDILVGQAYTVVPPESPRSSKICVARIELPRSTRPAAGAKLVETTAGERREIITEGKHANAVRGRRAIPRRTVKTDGCEYTLLVGNLHEHSNIPNSCSAHTAGDGTFFDNYRYGIDVQGYDFMALTDHDNGYYVPASWRKNLRAADFYDDGPFFIALPAYEVSFLDRWTWGRQEHPALGSQNLYFATSADAARFVNDKGELYGIGHEETDNLSKLLDMLHKKGIKDAVLPPHQLTDFYSVTDWTIRDGEYRTVMEIFQVRGSYEYEGCPWQSQCHFIPNTKEKAAGSDRAWAQDALAAGQRMGFFASGDHCSTGIGTAALMVKEVSRKGIIEALKARRCYATTGDKIFVDFRINDHIMGSEIKASADPHIRATIEGTDALAEIVIFKNNEIMFEKKKDDLGTTANFDVDLVDRDFTTDSFYYLRVIQQNNEIAWASPIWVDRPA